ncbi:MAG: hypothetical protein LBU64_14940, partial [Planctomycetota bacterium]|nr:hypothetical protein [Planctomycetota bacterium]
MTQAADSYSLVRTDRKTPDEFTSMPVTNAIADDSTETSAELPGEVSENEGIVSLLTPLDIVEDAGNEAGANVILFHGAFPEKDRESEMDGDDEAGASPILRLRRPPESGEGEETESESALSGSGLYSVSDAESSLSPMDRVGLLHFLVGPCRYEETGGMGEIAADR